FRFITSTNVVLSLQHSPHPSHPPFDGAISGARVVTNEFRDTRGHLHPNLAAVPADRAAAAADAADVAADAAQDAADAAESAARSAEAVERQDRP
ncbi:hypothetical protein IAE22_34075, partial [Bacillus sp. S34]|nr:hypothetical protein [Bacillus sp. S34]